MQAYVRNHWYAAALSAEIQPGALLKRTVLEESLVIFRPEQGRLAALEDRCPHRNAALSLGTVIGGTLQCGYHGLRFDRAGRCVHMPGQARAPSHPFSARSYPALDAHGYAWVWMGDAGHADPAAIPDYSWQTDPKWTGELRLRTTQCNYRLALENVLDLSHVSFVHDRTVGTPEVAETPADVTADENRVDIVRRFPDATLPAVYKLATDWERAGRKQTISYFGVNCVVLDVEIEPVGNQRPDQIRRMRFGGPYTPESKNSHIHFSSAFRDFDLGNASLSTTLIRTIEEAYSEDVPFLESQQIIIDAGRARPHRLFAVDKGPSLAMRLLDGLLDRQGQG